MDETPIEQMMQAIMGAHGEGLEAGLAFQQTKIDAILIAYDRAMQDDKTVMPSYLHAAIAAARLPFAARGTIQ